MDKIPLPQNRDGNMDAPPSAPAPAANVSTIAESPKQNSSIQPMDDTIDPSALITPIKVNEQQLKAHKKQLQLQLAVVNKSDDTPAPVKESKRSKADGKPLKWPPVSSSKSLAPLAGRMADLTRGEKGWGKRNTIEFEVNQECEFVAIVFSQFAQL